jgi:hypothetical protein
VLLVTRVRRQQQQRRLHNSECCLLLLLMLAVRQEHAWPNCAQHLLPRSVCAVPTSAVDWKPLSQARQEQFDDAHIHHIHADTCPACSRPCSLLHAALVLVHVRVCQCALYGWVQGFNLHCSPLPSPRLCASMCLAIHTGCPAGSTAALGAYMLMREVASQEPNAPSWQFLQDRWSATTAGAAAGGHIGGESDEAAALLLVISKTAEGFPPAQAAALATELLQVWSGMKHMRCTANTHTHTCAVVTVDAGVLLTHVQQWRVRRGCYSAAACCTLWCPAGAPAAMSTSSYAAAAAACSSAPHCTQHTLSFRLPPVAAGAHVAALAKLTEAAGCAAEPGAPGPPAQWTKEVFAAAHEHLRRCERVALRSSGSSSSNILARNTSSSILARNSSSSVLAHSG